jgi:DNA-binding NtrC family response regulator
MTQELVAKKALIMIVDDEEDILSVFRGLLTREGYSVHAFSNPEIAYEHFKYSPYEFSLILTDVRMPGMTGFQLARKVKELNPKVKVVLTSAFEMNMSEFEKILPNSEVDSFLDKPVSVKKLTEEVEEQLQAL